MTEATCCEERATGAQSEGTAEATCCEERAAGAQSEGTAEATCCEERAAGAQSDSSMTDICGEGVLSIKIMEDILRYMRTEAPLLAPIFRSDGQARLLSALMLDDEERSLTQLAEQTGLAYPSVHREVARLLQAGILTERQAGRTRLLRADPDSPLVAPLREILLITTGPVPLLKDELSRIHGIESAFLHGSFAARMRRVDGPAPNDIDLMVIGGPDPDAVYDACGRVEESVHRPVNPTITTRSEFDRDSGFHTRVRNSPTVPVLGELPWH